MRRDLILEWIALSSLKPSERNARTHSKKQIKQLAKSIKEFGHANPILTDDSLNIIAGHGRLEATKLLGWEQAPVIRLGHLSEVQKRALALADNRIAEGAGWNFELLAVELQAVIDLDFDVELTGFEMADIDMILSTSADSKPTGPALEDLATEPPTKAITQPGDLWRLGQHLLLCGNSLEAGSYATLMGDCKARVLFTDPPFNVPIDGHVCGSGQIKHREFAMAAGEMSQAQFVDFLTASLGHAASVCVDGAIVYIAMDWRHVEELTAAGKAVFSELKNICVWDKKNGGMGSFYRSQHELFFVFKVGSAPHTNNFGLGEVRYRTNIWSYPGISAQGGKGRQLLKLHPTVKPVALIEDALKDVSARGEIVLDPFGGSGSTLIAAEKCGRIARLIELDPTYCDVIVGRWEKYTGKRAILSETQEPFEDVSIRRVQTEGEAA